jgi:hypothetical protein
VPAHQQADESTPSTTLRTRPLFVPVRSGATGCAVRIFRTPLGVRTAVGFTSEDRLSATLGAEQQWIRLAEPALRAATEPLGVNTLTVDPPLAAPAVASASTRPEAKHRRASAPQARAVDAIDSTALMTAQPV